MSNALWRSFLIVWLPVKIFPLLYRGHRRSKSNINSNRRISNGSSSSKNYSSSGNNKNNSDSINSNNKTSGNLRDTLVGPRHDQRYAAQVM